MLAVFLVKATNSQPFVSSKVIIDHSGDESADAILDVACAQTKLVIVFSDTDSPFNLVTCVRVLATIASLIGFDVENQSSTSELSSHS